MNKKVLIYLGTLLVVIIVFSITYSRGIKNVELESSDSRWRAVCFLENENQGWCGTLLYQGEGKVTDISTELSYNGEIYSSSKDDTVLTEFPGRLKTRTQGILEAKETEKIFYTLIDFAEKPEVVSVVVKWTENGEPCEAKLHN
ncbi:MAG: hypothetical protein U0M21_09655 [Emergencia sp.]|nr:hypothetical protein [Emergencia sp.]